VADDDVRRAIRTWSGTGDISAEARLLIQRPRHGQMSQRALELRAWLGNAAAREAFGGCLVAVPDGRASNAGSYRCPIRAFPG